MRTEQEIVDYIREDSGVFGFASTVLVSYLSYEYAKEFLKKGASESGWEPLTLDRQGVLNEARSYMEFAWDKVGDHRGLSTSRSVEKLRAWCWLLGREDKIDWDNYKQYGAPVLKQICDMFDWPLPSGEWVELMASGEKCRPDCDEGCG